MKIAHFGTFDVENYGDLLFPLLMERRLGGEKIEFVHVSPVGGAPGLLDCKPVIGFEEALGECKGWDAIVLGGGALGHGDSAGEVEKYREPDIHTIAYPGLWLLPALISHLRGIPLAWNAPGVPGDFSDERKRRLLQWAAWQAEYLAVRDSSSSSVLAESLVEATVVPDTAVEVSRLWSEEELRSEIERLKRRKEWPHGRYLALHLNERYAGSDLPALAEKIKQICAPQGAAALLIAIGDCHGDTTFAHRILSHLQGHPASVFTPDSLRSVAAAIQFSDGYIGSSLHGAITAYSFARPFLIVAPPSRSKFAGFLDQIGAPERQVSSWAAATGAGIWPGSGSQSATMPDRRDSLEQALSRHWQKLSTALTMRRTVSAQSGPQLLETISDIPPEWFPLVAMLENSSLFAPLFKKYKAIWTPARQQLQNSAFVAAAAYRRLDLRHQKILSDLNTLQAQLGGLKDQRKGAEEKLDALASTIHKRDGRIETLEEQRKSLEEKLAARATLIHKQDGRVETLEEQCRSQEAQIAGLERETLAQEKKRAAMVARGREDARRSRQFQAKLENQSQLRSQADLDLAATRQDFVKLGKWSDRVLQDFGRLLHSNRWRLGCWLSLKRADDESKEARRLARHLESRPQLHIPRALVAEPKRPVRKENTGSPANPQKNPPHERRLKKETTPAVVGITLAPDKSKGKSLAGSFISIVIPVYNAYDALVQSLESVLRHTKSGHSVLMLDDASPDERIWPFLQEWESQHRNFRAIRNKNNLGYTVTINRGCELVGPGDIILLNSDTIVSPRWVEQMAACAYSRGDVATVTAISNAAGAFSVPRKNSVNDLPAGWNVREMAEFVERTSQRLRPIVPTGNGFCFYVTAAARTTAGVFDAGNFPRGYGEENDFCLRASAAGLVNLIDDATFVFHHRSASFGESKPELLEKNRAVLDRLHPEYTQRIRDWSKADVLDPVRQTMTERLEDVVTGKRSNPWLNDSRPCLLFVLHDGTGGTRFTSEDLGDSMAQSYRTILLLAALDHWTVCEYLAGKIVAVRRYVFPEKWRVDQGLSLDRLAVLGEICADYQVALAHVRHLLASGPELLDALRVLEIPVVFSFHDFYTICPTIQLLDEDRTYCAGRCTTGAGDCPLPGNWFRPPLPWLKHRYVHEHQRRMGDAIKRCDAFVTTSAYSRKLIGEHFPAVNDERFTVIEHGRDLARLELAKEPVADQPLRAVFFGALNPAKGLKLVMELLEENRKVGSPIELHILGQTPRNFDSVPMGGIYHGAYSREELPERVRAIGAAVSLVPSLWPETYCHVLTESWAMGLPVLASDIGTLRERVLQHGGGWLLPVGETAQWLAKLRELANDPQSYAMALEEVRKIRFPDVAWMARQYQKLYQQLLEKRDHMGIMAE